MAASKELISMTEEEWVSLVKHSSPSTDDLKDWEAHFERIARVVLLECVLAVNGRFFGINEIEFYYHGDLHLDVFTHQHPLQRRCGKWYFHSMGSSYKGGTYKGLDLTCALPGSSHAGGMLLRGMIEEKMPGRPTKDAEVQGSCKLVDAILAACEAASVAELVEGQMRSELSAFSSASPLHLERLTVPRKEQMFQSARVGLFLKKKDVPMELQHRFVALPYRFVTRPLTIAKGRGVLAGGILLSSAGPLPKFVRATPALLSKYTAAYHEALRIKKDPAARARALKEMENRTLNETEAMVLYILLSQSGK